MHLANREANEAAGVGCSGREALERRRFQHRHALVALVPTRPAQPRPQPTRSPRCKTRHQAPSPCTRDSHTPAQKVAHCCLATLVVAAVPQQAEGAQARRCRRQKTLQVEKPYGDYSLYRGGPTLCLVLPGNLALLSLDCAGLPAKSILPPTAGVRSLSLSSAHTTHHPHELHSVPCSTRRPARHRWAPALQRLLTRGNVCVVPTPRGGRPLATALTTRAHVRLQLVRILFRHTGGLSGLIMTPGRYVDGPWIAGWRLR